MASVSLLNLSYDSLLNMFLSERMFDGVLEPLGFSRKSFGAICCTSGIRGYVSFALVTFAPT